MRSLPCGRSSRGRRGARARSSSSRWSGTWPRPSTSATPSSPSSPARRRVSAPSPSGAGADRGQHRIRPGRHSLRGRRPRGIVPSPHGCPGEVPARPASGRAGDRELPGRAASRRRGEGARPSGGLRRAADARRAAPAVHLPDLRRPGHRRAGTTAGRETAPRERTRYRDLYEEAPNGYLSIGGDRRLLSANHRATQMIGHAGDGADGSAHLRPFRRHAGRPRPGPRRRSGPASPARNSPGWKWRCAAGTAARCGSACG